MNDPVRRAAYDRVRGGQSGGYSGSGDVQEVIRAKSFEPVNDMGKMRARLAITEDGESELALFDRNENHRWVGFQNDDGSSGLVLLDQNGKLSLRIGTNYNGLPFIAICDGNNDTRLWQGEASDEGTPMLFMSDRNGGQWAVRVASGTTGFAPLDYARCERRPENLGGDRRRWKIGIGQGFMVVYSIESYLT